MVAFSLTSSVDQIANDETETGTFNRMHIWRLKQTILSGWVAFIAVIVTGFCCQMQYIIVIAWTNVKLMEICS